jgi:hypothetical protein
MNAARRTLRSPSTIIAVVALVAACSGSAFAGGMMITGKDVVNGSITGADLRRGTITRADLAASARRPVTVTRTAHQLGAGPVTVMCDSGEVAVGGGGNAVGMWESQPHVDANGQADGWTVMGRQPSAPAGGSGGTGPVASSDSNTVAYVICQRP